LELELFISYISYGSERAWGGNESQAIR